MRYLLIPCLAASLLLSACSTTEEAVESLSADEIYTRAEAAQEEGNFIRAADLFEEVERLYPYDRLATEAQLQAAFSQYQEQRYDEAILSLERFIELHPGHPRIDYAYYLRALSFYEQISDVRRDQAMTEQALEALNVLIRRFPASPYTRDATLKADLALDHLAGKEMEIGRYYLNQNQVNAAINRFRRVIDDFQTTTHVPEALHRLVEAYLTLGVRDEAIRTAAVLGHNYPGSEWYEKTYALVDDEGRARMLSERSWLDRTVDSLLRAD